MADLMTKAEIRATVQEILVALGEPHLQVNVMLNNRFTARLGDARYDRLRGVGRVRFSLPLWPRASVEERRETIVHEVCHVVQRLRYPMSSAHGHEWKMLMRQAGIARAARCHTVDRTGLRRRQARVQAVCACGTHEITQTLARRMAQGTRYSCRKCRSPIQLAS